MKTLKQVLDNASDNGRGVQTLTKMEKIEALDIIAQDIMTKNTTALHGWVLLGIRTSMMNAADMILDNAKTEAELSEMAAALGKKGGEIISEAKAKTSRENGKKGGRPRGSGKKPNET